MNNTRFQKVAYWLLMLTIFFTYWLFSRQYTGPAFLSDEIGYLTKAAAFAGHPVDMASQWHGGYSLMLSPLFMIFSDPFVVWQGIMVLNAAIWTFSFMLLFCLLKQFFPGRDFWAVFFAVALSAAYPAWITMSGYTYSTTGFVFVFMLSIFFLLKSSADSAWSIVPHSLLVGFLYWIHPTGLAVAVASALAVAIYSWRYRRFKVLIFHVLVMVVMIAVYQFAVHNWISQIMTPENYPIKSHYKILSSVLPSFLHPEFWTTWFVISFGQISYLLIATLGVFVFAVVETWKRVMPVKIGGGNINTSILVNTSFAFIALSILGIVLLGSLCFASDAVTGGSLRIDHWIYGRYSEMALLPMLGVGFLALWRFKYTIGALFVVLLSGLMLYLYSNESNTGSFNGLISIQSFWPQALFAQKSFIFWFIIGAVGIILAGVLKKKLFVLLAVPLFFASISNQNMWHKNILAGYSKPSSLVDLVTSNFQHGLCIGFDTFMPQRASGSQRERRNLYSYYFFNYNIRRMSPDEWLSSCDGPYLTYRAEVFVESPEAKVIAREVSSGLFLVIKTDRLDDFSIKSLPLYYNENLYVDLKGEDACLIKSCFSMRASDLMRFSQVGSYKDGGIRTTGNSGYLFYGPYYPFKNGEYYIKLKGKFIDLKGAVLDIVSGWGKDKYLDITLSEYFIPGAKNILIPFSMPFDVNNTEIRLHVSSDTEVHLYGYSIGLNDGGVHLPEPVTGLFVIYRGKDTIPSQVGTHTESGMQSDGRAGYLMFGPYRQVKSGNYTLRVTGKINANGENVVVDVVGNQGKQTFARFVGLGLPENGNASDDILLEKKVTLDETVDDLEVRIWVDDKADIFIDGYSLLPIAVLKK